MMASDLARFGSVATKLGNYLRAKMSLRNMNQADLARATGLPEGTVSRYLNEPVPQPKLMTLVAISEGLQVPLVEIIQAAGFKVRSDASEEESADDEALLMLRSLPWVREILDDLAQLSEDDRRAVLAYLDALRRRPSQN